MSPLRNSDRTRPWYRDGKNIVICTQVLVIALLLGVLLFQGGQESVPLSSQEGPETPMKAQVDSKKHAQAKPEERVAQNDPDIQPAPAKQEDVAEASPEKTPGANSEAIPNDSSTNAPVDAQKIVVSATNISLDPERRKYFLIGFDQPVGKEFYGISTRKKFGTVTPELRGDWSWVSPYMLRFNSKWGINRQESYTACLTLENIIGPRYEFKGDRCFDIPRRPFNVRSVSIFEEPVSTGTAMVSMRGRVDFSYYVKPETFLENFKVIDSLTQKAIPYVITDKYSSNQMGFRTDPVQKKQGARKLKFQVSSNMQAAYKDITLDIEKGYEETYSLELDPNLRIKKIFSERDGEQESIKIQFSTPVRATNAKAYVTVSPNVDFQVLSDGKRLLLLGDFKAGHAYSVRVKHGLAATDGAVLRASYEKKIHMPNVSPAVTFKDRGMFLTRDGYKTLAIKSVNTKSAKLTIDRVYPNNLFIPILNPYGRTYDFLENYFERYSSYSGREINHVLGGRIVEKEIQFKNTHNKWEETPLELGTIIPEGEHGFYRLLLGDDRYNTQQRWVLFTDLGIVAKKGEDEVLVWVSSLETLVSRAGVQVQLLSDQNQIIAQGVTDKNGLWHAKGLKQAFKKHKPYVIYVKKGDDFSFLRFKDLRVATTGLDVGGEKVFKKGYSSYIYGERDIYRPGETAKGIALVRDARLQIPPAMPLRLRVKDPRGKKFSESVVMSDVKGQAEFSLPIPVYAYTGDYALELLVAEDVIGTYRFKVEEFVPDRIKVEITPDEGDVSTGDTLAYTVNSRYFFGPPAAGMSVESSVFLQAVPFAPKGYDDYVFGDPDGSFSSRKIFISKKGKVLGKEGNIRFQVAIPKDMQPPAALEAMITARVREKGGRGVLARQRVFVHAYSAYPGLKKLKKGGHDVGKEVELNYLMLTPQGEKTSSATLRVELYHDRWNTVLRRTSSGSYDYESRRDSELVSIQDITASEAAGSFNVVPPQWGSYRVVLTDTRTGAKSCVKFYASGWGYSPWAIENPSRIEIIADKKEYVPGEIAKFQIRSPFAGKMLVTVEGDSVLEQRVYELKENTAEVKFKVKKSYCPNVYVTAMVVRTATKLKDGGVARAFGATPFFVNREKQKVGVKIVVPEEIRSGTKLDVGIESEPHSTVTVSVVDEGILQLIAQKTPDPYSAFYAQRALAVDSYDTYSVLFPEHNPVMDKSTPGGDRGLGSLQQYVRTEGIRRVKPVAFWSGPLETDANGRVVYSVNVPSFNGALRVMAVAAKGKKFNASDHITRVKDPLIITPTFPRFLSTREKVIVPVTLRNETKKDGEFKLQLDVAGPVRVLEHEKTVELANGQEDVVYFTVLTNNEQGKVTCELSANGNGESAHSKTELGVRSSVALEILAEQSGGTNQKELVIPLEGAQGYDPQSIKRHVRIGPLPIVRFADNLKYLLRYPYGCLEQTSSRVFPLLYFGKLAEKLQPELFATRPVPSWVQSGIARLRSMQFHDGSFSMWPGGNKPHPWGSIYATHLLVEAHRAGYKVPEEMLKSALANVASRTQGKARYNSVELNRIAYGIYVLALAGKGDRGVMDYLHRQVLEQAKKKYPDFYFTKSSAAFLGAAYGLMGDVPTMKKLFRGDYKTYSGTRQSDDNFSSSIRNIGLRLFVLLNAAPDDESVPGLVSQLIAKMNKSKRLTTQENVFSFMALASYFAFQKQKSPYKGKLYAGGTLLGEFSNDTVFTMNSIKGSAPLRLELESGNNVGIAYYNVQTQGAPTPEAYKPISKGLEVERTYLTREGKPIGDAPLKQGDLIVMKTRVRTKNYRLKYVVVQNLLPTGLEVENPRLETTEKLSWIEKNRDKPMHQDIRDDRVVQIVSLARASYEKDQSNWQTYYSLLRVVTPGEFLVPPVRAEAMYNPDYVATGKLDKLVVISEEKAEEYE